jgi:hypothetical protein
MKPCPTCGSPVKIVGKTTMHYEPTLKPLDEDEVEKVIEKNKWVIGAKAMSGEQYINSSNELSKAICAHFGRPHLSVPAKEDVKKYLKTKYIWIIVIKGYYDGHLQEQCLDVLADDVIALFGRPEIP